MSEPTLQTTTHRIVTGDARDMSAFPDGSVDLVVTSPPYPMIEMWDGVFFGLDPGIGDRFGDGRYDGVFSAMHDALGAVWSECARLLRPGGIACINIGDATRTLGGAFRLWPNAAEVIRRIAEGPGLTPQPSILWRKVSNKPNKFMGSGMLPPNAYVAHEHESILVFRKGRKRRFEVSCPRRYESAYFYEERNAWFSDVWFDLNGAHQAMKNGGGYRERSGAFPLEMPCRLIHMFSAYGDTVLDPFLGTGTTTAAAMILGRNSAGMEIDPAVAAALDGVVPDIPDLARRYNRERIERHLMFIERYGGTAAHVNRHHGFPVVTSQEREIRLYDATEATMPANGEYTVPYRPVDEG